MRKVQCYPVTERTGSHSHSFSEKTYTPESVPMKVMPRFREIIEAPDLEEAQARAKLKLNSNYPIDWTVSIEELTP